MINDVTSTWQTGNHGNITLNKHYVPSGTARKRGKERGEEIHCDCPDSLRLAVELIIQPRPSQGHLTHIE